MSRNGVPRTKPSEILFDADGQARLAVALAAAWEIKEQVRL